MYYVYLIRSQKYPDLVYVGFTENVEERLKTHNAGKSTYTAVGVPWELVFYSAFNDKNKALAFEKYLKTHSGRSFSKKRLV